MNFFLIAGSTPRSPIATPVPRPLATGNISREGVGRKLHVQSQGGRPHLSQLKSPPLQRQLKSQPQREPHRKRQLRVFFPHL